MVVILPILLSFVVDLIYAVTYLISCDPFFDTFAVCIGDLAGCAVSKDCAIELAVSFFCTVDWPVAFLVELCTIVE